jgi:hypothetical protein
MISSLWREVKYAVESKRPELNSFEVRTDIVRILSGIQQPMFPVAAKEELRKVFRRASPWATAKTVGKAFLPNGQPTEAYNRLDGILRNHGIYIVEVGELECFAKSVSGRGPSRVNSVLPKDLKNDPQLRGAREFVRRLVSSS